MRRYYMGEKKRKELLEKAIDGVKPHLKEARDDCRASECRYLNNVIEAMRYGFYKTRLFHCLNDGKDSYGAIPCMKEFYIWKYDNFSFEDERPGDVAKRFVFMKGR